MIMPTDASGYACLTLRDDRQIVRWQKSRHGRCPSARERQRGRTRTMQRHRRCLRDATREAQANPGRAVWFERTPTRSSFIAFW